LNLTSALLKQIITQEDFDTWGSLRENYLPAEYQSLHKIISTHLKNFNQLPTFEDLKLSIRDRKLKEKVFAIEAVEVDVDAWILLEYLKNEYTQVEILDELDKFIERTVAISAAEENVESLQQIVLDVADRVDLKPPEEDMRSINLFDSDKNLKKYIPLGLNDDYDQAMKFSPRDLVLIGGRRGAGKTLTCVNIASNVYNLGRSSIYFTIEMDSRSILQRMCALGARVPIGRLSNRNLTDVEWRTWAPEDEAITFNCTKMRSAKMEGFTSVMDWETLKIGPQSTMNPKDRAAIKDAVAKGEEIYDAV
jgi:hypothetical protein